MSDRDHIAALKAAADRCAPIAAALGLGKRADTPPEKKDE